MTPSARQLEVLGTSRPGPLALACECSGTDVEAMLATARRHGARVAWAAAVGEVVCGRVPRYSDIVLLRLPSAAAAGAFVSDPAFDAATARASALQVTVMSTPPRTLALITALMARLLPLWPFDDTLAEGEEPGVGTSTVMPTAEAVAALRGHPDQQSPIAMVNWLKFKPHGGRAAYYRYARVAMTTTHSIGARLLYAARYRQVLVGNDGDPAIGRWDEFALMQYPGRAAFGRMAQLARYRAALGDREAGLAEHGQALTVSMPRPEFVWRR